MHRDTTFIYLKLRVPPIFWVRITCFSLSLSLLLGVHLDMKQRILGWCWSYWQPAEPFNVGLSLPRTMTDGKIILLQSRRPAVKERRSRPHRFEPLERIMVSIYLKWHSYFEVRPELGYYPHDSQALQFGGGVGFLSLVEGSGGATDDALLAIADLSQDSTEASGGGVSIEPESLAEIREGSDGVGCQ